MSTPIIQVDCASCGTTYRLALPNVLVNKPHKSMSFRCNHCSYKFQIQPKEILEQDAVAETLILVEADGFHVHHNLETVADLIQDGTYRAEDTIRVFGQEWSMMADEPSLAGLFQNGQEPENQKQDEQDGHGQDDDASVREAVLSTDSAAEQAGEDSHISDVALDFDESEDNIDASNSEHEFSEIDPFSEGYSVHPDEGDQKGAEDTLDADFFADSLDSGLDDEFDDFVVDTIQSFDESIDDPDLNIETSFDSFDQEHTVEATADVDHAIVFENEDEDDVTRVIDTASPQEVDATLMAEFNTDEDDDSFEDDFAVQAIQANLWDELESSAEDDPEDSLPVGTNSLHDEHHIQSVQSTKNALLMTDNASSAMVPEMELDDDVASNLDGESKLTESTVEQSESIDKENKPKQRLSFSNKVPEVKTVKKREVNPLYFFAAVVLFCIGLIGYFSWKSVEQQNANFAGVETNSNLLKPMTSEKDGLQQNTKEDGVAPENMASENGDKEPSKLPTNDLDASAEGKEDVELAQYENPYPTVLPDVPEESFDFANDKSSRELTREGYRALKDGRLDQAKKLFELALEKDENFADAVLGLGKTFQKRGELPLAKEAFCRHANLPSDSFSEKTMVEDVGMAQGIVFQLGLTCDDA